MSAKADRLYQWNKADARLKELKEIDRLISLVMEEAPSLDALKKIAEGLNVYLSHLCDDNDRDWNKNVDNKLKEQSHD